MKVSNGLISSNKIKTTRKGNFPLLEEQLYQWFLQQRVKNVSISGEAWQIKAMQLSRDLNITEFHASNGWLHKFKRRFSIRFLKVCGEKLSSQPELVEPFKHKLFKIIEDLSLTPEQIYNADESGLFFKLLPDKTYVMSQLRKNSTLQENK